MPEPIRVYVVEDNEVMREMLVEFLEAQPGFEVAGAAGSGEEVLDRLEGLEVDVFLVDMRLPGMNGAELIERILEHRPDLRCMVLSGHVEEGYAAVALDAGAHGYVLKGSPAELPRAVRTVMAGERYLSPPLRKGSADAPQA